MTSLVPFSDKGARLAAVFRLQGYKSSLNAAGQQHVMASFATIGYKGRTWSLRYRGETTRIHDDRNVPVPFLDVVVVGVSPGISKRYYEKTYQEGNMGPPDCWSVDGILPDASAARKQAAACGICPQNTWGSRVTQAGKKAKACSDSRRLAVVPLDDLDNETWGGPMMLALPPMSIGTFATYCAKLESLGFPLEGVGTRLKFDQNVAYPRIEFDPLGLLDDNDAGKIVNEVMQHPAIDRMLTSPEDGGEDETPAAAAASPRSAQPSAPPTPTPTTPALTPTPPPPTPPQPTTPSEEEAPPAAAAKVVDMPKRKAPFAAAVAAAADPAPAAKKKEAPAPAAAIPQTPNDLAEMIDDLIA